MRWKAWQNSYVEWRQVDIWRCGLSCRVCISTAVYWKCHASKCLPDVILCRSFTRPSTALGDWRPGNESNTLYHCTDEDPWTVNLLWINSSMSYLTVWSFVRMHLPVYVTVVWAADCSCPVHSGRWENQVKETHTHTHSWDVLWLCSLAKSHTVSRLFIITVCVEEQGFYTTCR